MQSIAPFRNRILAGFAMFAICFAPRAFAQPGDCEGENPPLALRIAALRYTSLDDTPLSTDEFFLRAICKAWPARPGTTIVAVAAGHVTHNDHPRSYVIAYDLELSLVDSDTGRIQAHSRWEEFLAVDTVRKRFDLSSIDTARYQLTPNIRAFGIRIRIHEEDPIERENHEELSLYIEENGQLRPVLERLTVRRDHAVFGSGYDAVEYHEHLTSTLTVEPTRHHGWADLGVRTRIRQKIFPPPVSEERPPLPPSTAPVTLRYDGHRYPVPESER